MTVLIANNVSSSLAAPISAAATSMTVVSGTRFPVLTAGQYFYATIIASTGTIEIVKVTVRSGNAMNITRAQDGTNAQAFLAGARVEMRINAASVREIVSDQNTPLEARLTTAEGEIDALQAADIALDARLDTAEAEIDVLQAFDTTLGTSAGSNSVGFLQAGTGATARTVQGKLRETVSVKDFGAVGDGSADDTTKIQACFTYCTSIGATAYFPAGVYSVDELTVSNGIGGIYCDGTIKGRGTASVAVIVLGSAGNPVTNANFVLRMDQSSGDLRAVQGYDTLNCSFTNCIIDGFVNSATLNHYAFWMEGSCGGNTWANNRISLYPSPTQRGFGIALYGTVGTGLPYGGFFNGVVSRAQFPAVNNTIVGNVILDGSYAVSLQASEYNTVSGNTFYNQNHRSIYLANASWGNTLNGNVLRGFDSSAVVLGYGSSNNVVSGNFCETTVISGEAAININSGAQSNLISGNKIKAASNYGVYIATDSIDTSVIGNDIGEHYLAAIAVENDFENPRPTNAVFSRPNYGPPPSPYTAWSFIDMTGVVIKNNTIRAGYTGRSTAAIYIAQITAAGNTKTSNITIDGNSVVSPTNIAYNLFIYEETTGYLTDLRITNSDFNAGNTEVSANTLTTSATWRSKISYFANNKQLDVDLVAEEINFADGDTSPSVLQNSGIANALLFLFANTAPTSVTTFDDGFENQDITVRLNANTTIVYNAALIRTKGAVDIVGSSTNQLVGFKRIGTVWLETWRNF